MTEIEAYQEYIRCKHNAFCKAVIRYAAIGKIIRLRQKWEREISLDYLTNEKFVQFAEPEQLEEYLFTACGPRPPFCTMRNLPTPLPFCQSGHGKKFSVIISCASRSA